MNINILVISYWANWANWTNWSNWTNTKKRGAEISAPLKLLFAASLLLKN